MTPSTSTPTVVAHELAYVAMSRARHATQIHMVGADPDEAAAHLTAEWSQDTCQRWVLDTGTPAAAGHTLRPNLARRVDVAISAARIRAERGALAAVTGAPGAAQRDLVDRLATVRRRSEPSAGGLGL